MLNRDDFVKDIKEVFGMAKDLYVYYKARSECDITTDELLNDDGFDYKLGSQVFHFKAVNENALRKAVDETNILLPRIKRQVLAILNCRNNSYIGTRLALETGQNSSWLCRYYLVLDYFEGRDGNKDEEKAVELATHALKGEKDYYIGWVKQSSLKEYLFNKLGFFYREKKDYLSARAYLRRAIELSPNNPTYLNNYGVVTFEWRGESRYEAFTFFKKAVEVGESDNGLLYILGVCYMFGFNNPDNKGVPKIHYTTCSGFKEARNYFERIKDYEGYDYVQYAYLSYIYECIGDTEIAEENDKKGADYGYDTAQLNYGKRLIRKAEALLDCYPTSKKQLYKEGIKYIEAAFKGKRAYWFNQCGCFLLEKDIDKCLNEAEQSYNSFMRRIEK